MFASEDALNSMPRIVTRGQLVLNGLNTLIDWVSFTLKEPLESVFQVLKSTVK